MYDFKQIKNEIGNDLSAGLSLLDQIDIDDVKLKNEFIEIKGRFNNNEDRLNRGLINNEDYTLELNRIRNSILYFIDKVVEKEDFTTKNQKPLISRIKQKIKPKSKTFSWVSILTILLIIGFGLNTIFQKGIHFKESLDQAKIKTLMQDYYDNLVSKNFADLELFYSDSVVRYFSKNNVPAKKIIEGLSSSRSDIIDELIIIDWDDSIIKKQQNKFYLDYDVIYTKKSRGTPSKTYELNMRVILNRELKIESIYEIKK